MTAPDWMGPAAPFDMVRRGYAPAQVAEYIEKLEYDVRIASANQDATTARTAELTAQLTDAQAAADALRSELDRYAAVPITEQGLTERLQRMVDVARAQVEEERRQADGEAARLRAEIAAERERWDEEHAAFQVEQQRAREALAQEVERRLAQAQAGAEATAAAAQTQAESVIGAARAQAQTTVTVAQAQAQATVEAAQAQAEATTNAAAAQARATTEAAQEQARRTVDDARAEASATEERSRAEQATIAEDFSLAIGARRTEAYRAIAESELQARIEANRRLDLAGDYARTVMDSATEHARTIVAQAAAEAHQRVADAERAVDALRAARADLTRQISAFADHLAAVRSATEASRQRLLPDAGEDRVPGTAAFPTDPAGRPTTAPEFPAGVPPWEPPERPAGLTDSARQTTPAPGDAAS